MTPWDMRVIPNPGCAVAQDLAVYAAVCCAALLLGLAVLRRVPPAGNRAGRCAALAILALTMVVGLWNWPVADDWCWASDSRRLGPAGVVAASYLTWTGRFGAYALQAWYGSWMSPLFGSIVWAWLLIAGTTAAAWFALRPAIAGRLKDRLALTIAVCGYATWIVTMEWPGHGLYWMSATTTYAVAIPGLLLLLGCAARIRSAGGRMWILPLALLAFALGGIGETVVAATLPLLVVWAGRSWLRRSSNRWGWTVAALAMTGGLLGNMLSPGTSARAVAVESTVEAFGGSIHLEMGELIARWFAKSLSASWSWVAHPVVILGAVAVAPAAAHLARRLGWGRERAAWEVPLSWLAIPGVVLAGYLPGMIALGHAPPWRGRDALQGLVLIVAFLALVRTMGAIRTVGMRRGLTAAMALLAVASGLAWLLVTERTWMQTVCLLGLLLLAATLGLLLWRHRDVPRAAAGWLLGGALVLGGSAPSLCLDAALYGPRWRAVHEVQDRTLRSSGPTGTVGILRLTKTAGPHHLWYYGAGSDPKHWINRGVASWYGVESVVAWPEACATPE